MLRASLARALGWRESQLEPHGVVVTSAGIGAPVGHAASSRGVVFAAERGLDLSAHRAHQLTVEDIDAADLVFCMDGTQVDVVRRLVPEAADRTALMAGDGIEIPDPHHASDEVFRAVAERIESAVRERVPTLVARISETYRSSR
jgi:protein-tyrosine phosphatase